MGLQSLTEGRSNVSQEIATNMQVSHFFYVRSTITNWSINQRPKKGIFDPLNTLSVVRILSDRPIFTEGSNFVRKLTFFVFLDEFLSFRENSCTYIDKNWHECQAKLCLSYQTGKYKCLSFRLKLFHLNHRTPENRVVYGFSPKIRF